MIPLPVLGEFLGTFIMMLLGEGVICSVVLNKTKSYGVGWLQTATGWAMAITLAVYVAGLFGPAHLNPAVSIALAFVGETNWADVPAFILAQFLGAMLANVFVWLHFFPHWKETTDTEAFLSCFCTSPAILHIPSNFFGEALSTAVLIIGVLCLGPNRLESGLGPIVIGILILVIGLCLGSTTGYAMNPARDLGPRIMHTLLPIPNKGDSEWHYAWVPVVGPLVGASIGAVVYHSLLLLL